MTARALLCLLFLAPPVLAAAPPPDLAEKADAYMRARVAVNKFNGTVLIGLESKPLFARGYGFANIEHEVPNTPKTKFRIASVSKQFLAAVVLMLEAEGKLKLDDKLEKLLPDAPKEWGAVTVHQLLSHTSGVPENLRPAMPKGLWPLVTDPKHVYDVVKDKPLDFKPGEKFSYSNTGYALLGRVVQQITGRPYEEVLKERVFDPLGMRDTGVDDRRLVLKNRASGYGRYKGDPVNPAYIEMSLVYASGSIYSTVEDLLKWDSGLSEGKLLPKKELDLMFAPQKSNYACGWIVINRRGRKTAIHDGALPGFRAEVLRQPDQKLYVAVLSNFEGTPVLNVAYDLSAIAQGDPYDLPVDRKEVSLDGAVLDKLAGEYELEPKKNIAVTKSLGQLYVQIPGQGRFGILPESEALFFCKQPELIVTFARDKSGQVTELVIREAGQEVHAKKVK